jgi:hypothetical protein
MDNHGEREYANEDSVDGDRRFIGKNTSFEWAELECAVCIGAEADETVGQLRHRVGVEWKEGFQVKEFTRNSELNTARCSSEGMQYS